MEDLWDAVYQENFEKAKYLLEKKADPEYTPVYQRSLLQSASSSGNIKMMKLLLEHKADINAKNEEGKAALTRAALEGGFDAVVFLVEHNADVNTFCSYGTTPLKGALFNGRISIADYLIKKGATQEITSNFLRCIGAKAYLVAGFLCYHYPNEKELLRQRTEWNRFFQEGQKYYICYESIILFCLWFNKTYKIKDLSRIISKEVWAVMCNKNSPL